MEKVNPDVYRKRTPFEYETEFERINKEIRNMDDVDFEILINTDVPFYCDYMERFKKYVNYKDCYNPTFKEFTQKTISVQKSAYIHYLQMLFMFPNQRN